MAFTAIAAAQDWQDVDLVNEIISALNERSSVCLPTPPFTLMASNAGDDAHSYTFWTNLQQKAEDLLDYFVVPDLDPTDEGLAIASITLAQAFEYAGYPASVTSWRRMPGNTWPTSWTHTDDPPDAAFSFGQAQIGDAMGPWILEDLQRVISVLHKMKLPDDFTYYGEDHLGTNKMALAEKWGAADSVALTAYNNCYLSFPTSSPSSDDPEFAYYVRRTWTIDAGAPNYQFGCERRWTWPERHVVVPASTNFDWNYYVFPKSYWAYQTPPGGDPYFSPDEIDFDAATAPQDKWHGPLATHAAVTDTTINLDDDADPGGGMEGCITFNGEDPDDYVVPLDLALLVDDSTAASGDDYWWLADCWLLDYHFVWVMP